MKWRNYLISYKAKLKNGGFIDGEMHFKFKLKMRYEDLETVKQRIVEANQKKDVDIDIVIINNIYYFGKFKEFQDEL